MDFLCAFRMINPYMFPVIVIIAEKRRRIVYIIFDS